MLVSWNRNWRGILWTGNAVPQMLVKPLGLMFAKLSHDRARLEHKQRRLSVCPSVRRNPEPYEDKIVN